MKCFATFLFILRIFAKGNSDDDEISLEGLNLNATSETLPFAVFDVRNEDIPRKKRSETTCIEESESREGSEEQIKSVNNYERNTAEEADGARQPQQQHFSVAGNECFDCGAVFKRNIEYQRHCEMAHGRKKIYFCQVCPSSVSSYTLKWNLLKHVHDAHPELMETTRGKRKKELRCKICSEHFPGIMAFQKHAMEFHPKEKLIQCRKCDAAFTRVSAMSRHSAKNHVDQRLTCKYCKKTMGTSQLVKEHQIACHYKFKGKNTLEAREMKRQQRTLTRCQICDKNFKYYTYFREHCRLQHPGVKFFPCAHCKKSFTSHSYLETHTNIRHPDKTDDVAEFSKKFTKGRVYACEYCSEEFVGQTAFEKHGIMAHPGQKMFHCGNCSIPGFTRKNALMRHLQNKHGDMSSLLRKFRDNRNTYSNSR